MSRAKIFLTSALILTALISGCGNTGPTASSPAGTDTAANPYAGGASYPWVYTAPAGQLSTLTLTPGQNTLYYEPLLAASNGWGPIEIDHSNGEQGAGDGRPLTLNGVVYQRGFGVHANSEMRYSLKGTGATCTTFTADVGVDDEVGNRGSVVFKIYLDGVKKYDSGVLTGSSATRKVSVNIAGAQELRLIVTNGGDNIDFDHADWANPRIFCVRVAPPPPSGSLDPSFGQNGVASVGGVDAALEPDSSVLIADTLNGDFALKRLRPDGSVQQVQTNFGGNEAASALVRQPDGKIVVVGSSNTRFAVARYNTNLSLDTGFGLGGKVLTSVSSLGNGGAYAVALQPDGKIVAAGTALSKVPAPSSLQSQDLAAVRYTASGQLDPTFGTGGISIVGFDAKASSYSDDEARAVVIQPGGGIVIAGKSDAAGGGRAALLTRLTPGGALDTGFGSSGSVIAGGYAIYNDVIQETNGNLVVLGYQGRYYGQGVVRRYGPNGNLLGDATITFAPSPSNPLDANVLARLLVQPDGKLLISGVTRTIVDTAGNPPGPLQTMLARLNPDLSLDTSFGTGGRAAVPVTSAIGLEDVPELGSPPITPLRQADGKILLVGKQTARLYP